MSLRFTLITLVSSIILTGCMVGPDFRTPKPPGTPKYTKSPLPKKTVATPGIGKAGKAQHLNMGQDIPAAWWTLFHSKELDALICTGLANSPNLAAAKATLRQAQANLRSQYGLLLLPAITGQAGAERERFSNSQFGANSSSLFNLYNASVSVNYTLDVFGGLRRQIEGFQAVVDYERYELIAAYLTLTSNIVTTSINIASLGAQIAATKQLIKAESDQLTILRKQYKLGGISNINVLFQETQVAQSKALLPPLQNSLAQNKHALAVLIGFLPSQANIPVIDLDKLTLPTEIPLSIPSRLVKQRPDVQASMALLHQASSQIGVATANLFPQITLSATDGSIATIPSLLFKPASHVWNYGALITQPLFRGGGLWAARKAAIAAFEAAYASYCQTVLQAFQNVADTLRALEYDARTLKMLREAEVSAKANLDLTQQQFKLGGVNYLSLLIVQQEYQQALINRIRAQGIRYADTAALFQALGGGWWNVDVALT